MNEQAHCERWEPVPGIESPCSDIAFSFESNRVLTITMYFHPMVDAPNRDLVMKFKDAIAFKWNEESVGFIHPLPPPGPTIDISRRSKWTFPTLQVINSSWLAEYLDGYPDAAEGRAHFVLLSLDDEVEILASPDVEAEWIDGPPDRDETSVRATAMRLWGNDGGMIQWYKGDE
jgi:hypothetical protein